MPKKKTVNSEKLLTAIESGMPSTEIMSKFGIKTSAQLKSLYLDALISKGTAPAIPGRGAKKAADEGQNEIKVNKRGSIVLAKKLVDDLGFEVGEKFVVRRTKAGLILKKQ